MYGSGRVGKKWKMYEQTRIGAIDSRIVLKVEEEKNIRVVNNSHLVNGSFMGYMNNNNCVLIIIYFL